MLKSKIKIIFLLYLFFHISPICDAQIIAKNYNIINSGLNLQVQAARIGGINISNIQAIAKRNLFSNIHAPNCDDSVSYPLLSNQHCINTNLRSPFGGENGIEEIISTETNSQPDLIWPVLFTNPQNLLSDGFGPRLKTSDEGRYDFHRGIDILGAETDIVVAVADGEVYRAYAEDDPTSTYPNSGNVVILEHRLSDPIVFQNETISTYYTLYMHLSSMNVAEGDSVIQGEIIGNIGHTGDTDFTHLHFEIRLGTTCSLESTCNHGYDPHINPFAYLPYTEINTVSASENVLGDDLEIAITMPRNELDFNNIILTTHDSLGAVLLEKELDLNNRIGIDASSTEAIDTQLYDGIYLEPEEYSSSATSWVLHITFQDSLTADVSSYSYTIKDVNNNVLYSR